MSVPKHRLAWVWVWALIVAYLVVVLRDAWVGDDIFITLRTVKQWIHRGELVWNPHERVQAYTHPLWMMLLAAGYALTHEAFYTTLTISVLCSLAAIFVVLPGSKSRLSAMLFVVLLVNSRAYVDYSTSGLENPLTHLLCAIAMVLYLRAPRHSGAVATRPGPALPRRVAAISLCTALAMCNRLDSVLLLAPMALATAWQARTQGLGWRPLIRATLLGALPIVAWECFSLIYYGSFVPNTALAKLNTQIPSGELFVQGLNYFYESLHSDHLTLSTIAVAVALPWVTRDRRHAAIVGGAVLYTLYVLKIGGDFMSGRFLTAPFFMCAALVTRVPGLNGVNVAAASAVALLLNLSSPRTTIPLGPPQTPPGRIDHRGIADERGFYMGGAGLDHMNRHNDAPHRGSRYDGESLDPKLIHVRGAMGYVGFHAALDTYLVDHWALTDPLVARLPAIYHPKWRIGHFSRALPAGYIDSLHHNEDRFANRNIARYYEHLKRITRGPLWSAERWASIWKLQTGQLDSLIPKPFFRYHGALGLKLPDLIQHARSGKSPYAFGPSGVFVDLQGLHHEPVIAIDLDADDDYRLLYEAHGKIIGHQELPRVVPRPKTPQQRLVHVPADIATRGYHALRIVPVRGHEPYRLWHLHLANSLEHEAQVARALQAELAKPAKRVEPAAPDSATPLPNKVP